MKKMVKLNCENCKVDFYRDEYEVRRRAKAGRRIFCSQPCASKIRSKECLVDVECKECGIKFSRRKGELKSENVFCSSSCSNTHTNKKLIGSKARNFKHGKSMYRDLALKHKPCCCEICGFDKDYAIEVHHIDRDRSNNHISNLMVVCSNCHSGIHKEVIKI